MVTKLDFGQGWTQIDGKGKNINNYTILWVGTDPYVVDGVINSSGFYH